MPRPKAKKPNVRLSVSLDEGEYEELTRLAAELDLSAAWLIRRAVSEFVARHRDGAAPDLPLQRPVRERRDGKTAEGSHEG